MDELDYGDFIVALEARVKGLEELLKYQDIVSQDELSGMQRLLAERLTDGHAKRLILEAADRQDQPVESWTPEVILGGKDEPESES